MTKTLSITLIAAVLGLSATLPCSDATAQAYCALRDPVSQIYSVCPEADNYRSVVRTIDESAREAITTRVPYPMHFTELGRHTLYVGIEGRRPVGLVQARSERSRWGLVEVIWSFDLDLRVADFALQRCRARSADRKEIESDAFKSLVRGRSFDELLTLVSADGKSLSPEVAGLIQGDPGLALAVLRCGIKTVAATEAAWSADVQAARLWHRALTCFPQAVKLAPLAPRDGSAVLDATQAATSAATSAVRSDGVQMFEVLDAAGERLGAVVRTDCDFGNDQMAVWWSVDAQGEIRGAQTEHGGDPLVTEALEGLRGLGMKEIGSEDSCANPLGLVAAEVLTNVTPYMDGE